LLLGPRERLGQLEGPDARGQLVLVGGPGSQALLLSSMLRRPGLLGSRWVPRSNPAVVSSYLPLGLGGRATSRGPVWSCQEMGSLPPLGVWALRRWAAPKSCCDGA